MPPEPKKKNKIIMIVIGVAVLLVLSLGSYFLFFAGKDSTSNSSSSKTEATKKTTITKVGEAKRVFTGGYADPSILKKSDGTYIMYLNKFGGKENGYFVLTSTDADTWTEKTGVLFTGISVGRAFQTENGIRFYYPEQMPLLGSTGPMPSLLSAFSTDGFSFMNDSGKRITPKDGYFIGGSTVFKLPDGKLRMYFEEPKSADPMRREGGIWGASSTDGLTWTRDPEITIEPEADSSNQAAAWGQALHPFVVTKPDGSFVMFYNTHSEIYAQESKDGIKWTKIGKLGIHGADSDGVYLPNGTFRLYYGDFSPQTSGEVYYIDLKIT